MDTALGGWGGGVQGWSDGLFCRHSLVDIRYAVWSLGVVMSNIVSLCVLICAFLSL